jgi:hypothetical protein
MALFIVFEFWHAMKTWDKLWSDVEYNTRYIECDPNELFVELEHRFQWRLPAQIWEVKTARNYGSWDSTTSCYIVRFCAEPNSVDVFLSSFPKRVNFVPYTRQEDTRYLETKNHLAPSWFTEPINDGKIGYAHDEYDCYIFIDTSVEQRYVVYLWGYGDLPMRDANSRDGNVVSGLQKKTVDEDSRPSLGFFESQ